MPIDFCARAETKTCTRIQGKLLKSPLIPTGWERSSFVFIMKVMSASVDLFSLFFCARRCQGGGRLSLFPTLFSLNLAVGALALVPSPSAPPLALWWMETTGRGFLEEFPAGTEPGGTVLHCSYLLVPSNTSYMLFVTLGRLDVIFVAGQREITIHSIPAFPGIFSYLVLWRIVWFGCSVCCSCQSVAIFLEQVVGLKSPVLCSFSGSFFYFGCLLDIFYML